MSKERYEAGKAPVITISECNGDLLVGSWSDTAVLVQGGDCNVVETEGGLTITSNGKLRLTVPPAASIGVEKVSGDLVIKNVNGDMSIQEVQGDGVFVGLNHAKISTIHGDLSAKNMNGPVSAETVHGDAVFRNVQSINLQNVYGDFSGRNVNGSATLGQVMGDIGLRTLNGDLNVGKGQRDANLKNLGGKNTVSAIHGDIRLFGGLVSGDHTFNANGDIVVSWPSDAPLNLSATANSIKNRLTLDSVEETETSVQGRMGDGKTNVTLQAGGRLILRDTQVTKEEWDSEDEEGFGFDFSMDFGALGERISQQINRVTTELQTKFGPDFTSKISSKAEEAAAKAEKAAERAMRELEMQMEKMNRKANRPVPPVPPVRPVSPVPPTPPTPKAKKSSAEEQLKILRMVESGTITPDEAAMLLKALDE